MGRPLSQKLLEKMNIKVSVNGIDRKLVKQVGFNKYEIEKGGIVTLGEDASLLIFRGDKGADVIKIVRNTLYTNGGFVAEYRIKEEGGGIELLDSSLTLSTEVKDGVDVDDDTSEPTDTPTGPSEPTDTPTGPTGSSQDVVDGDDEEE